MLALLGWLLLVALAGETDYLVRFQLTAPAEVNRLAARDIRVITDFPGGCLAVAGGKELQRLDSEFCYWLLDTNPALHSYYLVTGCPSRISLDRYGKILAEIPDAEGVTLLLRTTQDAILDLNRLPVQLYRLPLQPLRFTQSPAPVPASATADSLIWQLVNRVSEDSVRATIQRLQNFVTRYTTTESCRAAVNYALDRMRTWGCDSVYADTWQANAAPNAVGIKVGRVNPRIIYALCAHIDNTSEQAPNRCPGADDNAAGVATVLEACRVLADCEFDYTFRFLIFTGEEQGLLGSASYCSRAAARGDSIMGAMNFDMISYGLAGRDSMVIWKRTMNPNCTLLANFWIANADTYTTLKYYVYTLSSGGRTSDHASFWDNGYQCIRNKELDVTPMYHTTGDTIGPLHYLYCGTNDIPLCVEAIKAAVATFAKLAGVRPLTGVVHQPAFGQRMEANHPNPFRTATLIRYPPGEGKKRIVIYDPQGRPVRHLNGNEAGQTVWDRRDNHGRILPAGIYFYRCLPDGLLRSAVVLDR